MPDTPTLWKRLTQTQLTTWIFLALALGLVLGVYFPEFALGLKPLRTLFLNGIKCIVAPLIFGSIVTGIASSGGTHHLGKTGIKAIIYFEIATTLALVIGLIFVNVFQPGLGIQINHDAANTALSAASTKMSLGGFVEHLLPHNIADAIVRGDVLQIVIFSVIFGIAVVLTGQRAAPMIAWCEALNDIMFRFTGIIMMLAPLGVGAAMAAGVAEHGLKVLVPMLKLVGTLYVALVAFFLIVLVPALMYARVKWSRFWREIKPSFFLAFATTSSESAYPSALEALERMGVKKRISSFVLPLGYSFNLDGSTLYLAVASIFVAQASGIELSWSTQLAIMLSLMLTTKGVAAVPRASFVVLSGTLVAFGLPLEALVLILGVDEFLDMARTSINLMGNCVATLVVSRWEGERIHPEYSTDT